MKIKQVLFSVVLAVFLFPASLFATEMTVCPVEDLDMEMSLPTEYDVFTRDMSDDDPILVDSGVTKENLFKNDSVYLAALSEDRNKEVILTMIRTDWSEMYYDFNDLSEEDLEGLAKYCLINNSSAVEMSYWDYGLFRRNDQAQFLQATGTFEGDGVQGSSIQYVTVINGNAYTITFNFYGENITEGLKSMSEDVVSSVVFHNVEENSRSSVVFYILCVLVLVALIGVLLAVIRKKKYTIKNLNAEPSKEAFPERETEVKTAADSDPSEEERAREETKE